MLFVRNNSGKKVSVHIIHCHFNKITTNQKNCYYSTIYSFKLGRKSLRLISTWEDGKLKLDPMAGQKSGIPDVAGLGC